VSKVRLDFLNWRPDEGDFENPLIEAKNVLHQSEGWVPYKRPTAGAISAHSTWSTTPSMIVKPIGTGEQYIGAWLESGRTAGAGWVIDLKVGLLAESSGNYSLTAGYTTMTSNTVATKSTLNNVVAFDVCEGHDASGDPVVFFSAIAQGKRATTSASSIANAGWSAAAASSIGGININGWSTI